MTEWHDYVPNRGHGHGDQEEWGNDCLDCHEHELHASHWKGRLIEGAPIEWEGDTPFYLIYEPPEGPNIGIDLDAPGWIDANQELFRSPGTWLLMSKQALAQEGPRPLFVVFIRRGDQFYYAKRHSGVLGGATAEIVATGIGKKQADGKTVNLWLMPNGMICGGDDVDFLSQRMLGLKP